MQFFIDIDTPVFAFVFQAAAVVRLVARKGNTNVTVTDYAATCT